MLWETCWSNSKEKRLIKLIGLYFLSSLLWQRKPTGRESADTARTISLHQWQYSRTFVNKQQQQSNMIGLSIKPSVFEQNYEWGCFELFRTNFLEIDRRKKVWKNLLMKIHCSTTSIERMFRVENSFEAILDNFFSQINRKQRYFREDCS